MVVGALELWLAHETKYESALIAELVLRLAEAGMFGLTGQEVLPSYPFPTHQ